MHFLKKKLDEDIRDKHTLIDDIKKFRENTGGNFEIDDYVNFIKAR